MMGRKIMGRPTAQIDESAGGKAYGPARSTASDALVRLLCWSVPAVMLAFLLRRPVWDVDIFWQLKLGELILDRGGPIPTEPFAALHAADPLPAVAWAGQAVMALVRRLGGWDALRVFDALCWLAGFWSVALASRMRGASAAAVALALGCAFVATLTTASIRPQTFACLCFGLLLALRRLELRPAMTVALGAPLMVAWQNLHPSVGIGVAAMGFAALPGWIGWLRGRGPIPVCPTVLAAIGAAAVFVTPDGLGILAISARNAEASVAIGASEWLPLWIPANLPHALPVLLVVLVAARFVWRTRRFAWEELAVAGGLLVMAILTYRFMLFWGVAMIPVIARAATGGTASPPPGRAEAAWVAGSVALTSLIMPLAVPTHFSPSIPVDAVRHLRKFPVRGTVYGDFPFGGVIIDTGYPDWKVAYDGRYYRYSPEEWQYNGGIETGVVPLVDVVRKWNPAAFVLDSRHNVALSEGLARSRAWQRIYAGGGIVVYVPRIVSRADSKKAPTR